MLFQGSNSNQTAQAMSLRQHFIDIFQPNGTCTTLYHGDEGLCMFEPNFKPWGPFVTAEWAIFIPKDRYMDVVPWMMQRRFTKGIINAACVKGDNTCIGVPRPAFSILVHPNTGCEYQDHGLVNSSTHISVFLWLYIYIYIYHYNDVLILYICIYMCYYYNYDCVFFYFSGLSGVVINGQLIWMQWILKHHLMLYHHLMHHFLKENEQKKKKKQK